ncbi:MAG TPA: amidohydrolase family protein [Gemmatimonadales bacterium]|nr:amidohydrolase family protein [Gemmatimonadales bacterium]
MTTAQRHDGTTAWAGVSIVLHRPPSPSIVLQLLLAALLVASSSPARAQTIAITGGAVYPVSRLRIENATVLIRDGRIAAVGANVQVPAGARQVDARGKWVTPGLIDVATQIGLTEIGAVEGTNEGTLRGNEVAAAFNVLEGVNPASQLIPVARIEGITTVMSGPGGGLISGQAVALDLWGDRIEDMVIESPVAMVGQINEGAKGTGGGSRAGVMARLRRLFNDAREYDRRRTDYQRRQMQPLSAPVADLEAILPVLRGELPLVLGANRRSDIENALRLAREYNLRLLIDGAVEGWQVADQLAAARVPVIINPLADIPTYDGLSPRLENAALLSRAGVQVIISSFDSHNSRNIKQLAGNAVAYGMDWDAALRAVTLGPATALGIGDRYGSLEVGKVADVVVWSGDPFEFSTAAETVLVRGTEVPLTSRQRQLMERYKTLPPRY